MVKWCDVLRGAVGRVGTSQVKPPTCASRDFPYRSFGFATRFAWQVILPWHKNSATYAAQKFRSTFARFFSLGLWMTQYQSCKWSSVGTYVWGERRKKENLLTPWVLKTMNDIRSSLKDGRGFSQTQHNEHNGSFLTCHSDKPTCSRTLPRRDNGSGGPHVLCGSGGGAQLLVDYIYFFLLSTEVWKFFFFNFEVDWALAELMSWTRWIGLRLAFILQMKKYLLSYHNLFLFSLERVWKNSLWETERGVRRGPDGMGSADHWDESSVKRGCMKEEWKSGAIYMLIYGHWWPSNRLK